MHHVLLGVGLRSLAMRTNQENRQHSTGLLSPVLSLAGSRAAVVKTPEDAKTH